MTTEIATLDTAPAPALAGGTTNVALNMLRTHADMMATAHQLASALVRTGIVPVHYRGKPDEGTAAILYGVELGLTPIQSLQNVFNVNGNPAIYARTMAALLRNKGFKFRTVETSDERVTVECTAPDGESETSTWDIARADKAGYTRNDKYKTDPQAMLYAKAVTETARKLAPDLLLGIPRTMEELELDPPPMRVTSERVTPVDIAAGGEAAAGPVVQQWQPPVAEATEAPEAASDQGEKPDTAQVEASAEPKKRAPRRAKATPARLPMINADQLAAASVFLDQLGVTERDDKRDWMRKLFERPDLESTELTREEGAWMLDELSAMLAEERRDTVAEAVGPTAVPDAEQLPIDGQAVGQ